MKPINLSPSPSQQRHAAAIRDYPPELCAQIISSIDHLGRKIADAENWWLRERRRALAARLRALGIPLPKRPAPRTYPRP